MQPNDGIALLVGRQVSSVEFVHDYVQLHFDGLHLTVNAPFAMVTPSATYGFASPESRELLSKRVGRRVTSAETVPDKHITLKFDDGVEMQISLIPEDQVGPEAAVLSGQGLDRIYVW